MLNIADNLQLPASAITETIAILAKRGAGKSYTASVIAEEMLSAGAHVVALDPVGVWWGLRASASGDADGGLPILIFGGGHADIPLNPTQGRALAELIVYERLSAVLDLSHLTTGETTEFLSAFLAALYQIKATHREAMHLIVDEADAVAPQSPGKGEMPMLSAMDAIVRRGRSRGMGVTLITQRPAVLSKNVLTQIEVLIAQRVTSPNDRKAIDGWISSHGTDAERKMVMGSLATLNIGEAIVWSPNLLGELRRVKIRPRRTFDSSATPRAGETLIAPRTLASVDMSGLRERFSAQIAEAEATDPVALQRQIADLKKQLTDRPTETKIERVVERVEVPVLPPEMEARMREVMQTTAEYIKDLAAFRSEIGAALSRFGDSPNAPIMQESVPVMRADEGTPETVIQETPLIMQETPETIREELLPVPSETPRPDAGISRPQQRILDAIAGFEALGVKSVARSNVAIWSDASPKSSAFTNNLGALRTAGYLDYPAGGTVALTSAGRGAARTLTKPATREALLTAWIKWLPAPQGRILKYMADIYPRSAERDIVAEYSGASPSSSAFTNNLGALRALGLIDYPKPRHVQATALLFPKGSQ